MRRLIERTLREDPQSRLRDVGDARVVVEESLAGHESKTAGTAAEARATLAAVDRRAGGGGAGDRRRCGFLPSATGAAPTPDGRLIAARREIEPEREMGRIHVVFNWFDELERLAPH